MLEIVAGVDDYGQPVRTEHVIEADREFGPADAPAQRNDVALAHRNRSVSIGRTRAAADVAGSSQSKPRNSTAGCPSAPCPISSEAAAAISSATAISVTRSLRPNRSGLPTMLRTTGSPAAPSAIPTTPTRQGRPKLSLMIIAR